MKTVGKQLQEARIAKEWSPELAARETKIKVERLHELETDDYSNFSSPTYARGFVRTYARALGLDEYKILRQLDNKLPEDDNATFVNDTGVPYMPEPSQSSGSYKVGTGVYVALGVGATVLFLIAFILFQSYRVGYFAKAIPLPPAPTNAAPVTAVTEAEPVSRALPADSNAAPVALPVDIQPVPAVATAAPATTNQAPVTAPSTNAAGTTNSVTAVAVTTNAPAAEPAATPLDTKTPPRALPVDLNALAATPPDSSATTNAPPAVTASTNAAPATNAPTAAVAAAPATNAPPVAVAVPTPIPAPRPPPSLSARGANARPEPPPKPHADAYSPVPLPIVPAVPAAPRAEAVESATVAATAPAETAPETAAPLTGEQPAPSTASDTMSAPPASTSSDSANTGAPAVFTESSSAVAPASNLDKAAGKRLVLTASHDSYIRVVSLDGHAQVRYSSVLHQGQSISFNDRKYSINVAIPSAVNIALDGINYGPHSDHAEPDTFTVESHQP